MTRLDYERERKVREQWEADIAQVPGAVLIPLGDLPARLGEVPAHREVVTVCHHGMRSLTAQQFLRGAGFSRVWSLKGGVDEWARQVDPAMRRY